MRYGRIQLAVLALFCIVLMQNSCKSTDKQNFEVSCSIKNTGDSIYAKVLKTSFSSEKLMDSLVFVDNQIAFDLPVSNQYERYSIVLYQFPTKAYLSSFDFWSKDENVIITGELIDRRIVELNLKGCELNHFENGYRDIFLTHDSLFTDLLMSAETSEDSNRFFTKTMTSINEDQLDFIINRPNNAFSLSKILSLNKRSDINISSDNLMSFYDKLSPELKNSSHGRELLRISNIKQLDVGDAVVDFQALDIEGNQIRLSDYKGKIVLLDFWASWCHPCRQQIRTELADLYKKYSGRELVIISYSLDDQSAKEKWQEAVEEDEVSWISISNLKGFSDPLAQQYSVRSIPQSFLIDKSGRIVESFDGYEEGSNKIEKAVEELVD